MTKPARRIRIVIADDHPIFREGLRRLLHSERDMKVVGQATDGEQALKLLDDLKPDVLLLDLAMPRLSGLETLRHLTKRSFSVHVIVLTAGIFATDVARAFQLGAKGVILKESAVFKLLDCIRAVMAGQRWLFESRVVDPTQFFPKAVSDSRLSQPLEKYGLTSRELEIISVIVAGYANKEIAQKLSISEQTVKNHLRNVFNKLGVSNRLELGIFAINHQLVQLP